MTFGGHHPQGVLQRGDDGREIFPGSFFAAGQIEDKTVPAGARHGAGKHGAGGVLQSLLPHGNGNGSDLPFEDAEGRFGGDVPGERPVPPVVMIRSSCFSSAQAVSMARMAGISSGMMAVWMPE